MEKLLKILVVEDDPIIAMDIQYYLTQIHNTEVFCVHEKQSALDYLKIYPVDLVVLDIHLEGRFDGIEIAEFIKKTINCPFVFLTSFSDDLTFSKAANCVPNGYIVKPFNVQTLISTLKLALQNHLHIAVQSKVAHLETRTIQSQKISEILDFIINNIEKRLSTEVIAKHVGWNRSHFSRAFKREMGVSPKEYIDQKKIEKALELIKQRSYKLIVISEELGFKSYSSFVVLFKKYTGYTPSDYQLGQ